MIKKPTGNSGKSSIRSSTWRTSNIDMHRPEHVGMALLYAAARFNSFVVASRAPEVRTFDAERPAALEFFSREYLRMLNENLDDYRKIHEESGKYAHLVREQ